MGRWLNLLGNTQKSYPTKLTQVSSVGYVGTVSSSSEKINGDVVRQARLRARIMSLQSLYGDSDAEWGEYAAEVIRDWSRDLDEAIRCFELLAQENKKEVYV